MWVQETLCQISFRVVYYWNTTLIISKHIADLQKQLVPCVKLYCYFDDVQRETPRVNMHVTHVVSLNTE